MLQKRLAEQKRDLQSAQLSLQLVENINKKFEAEDKLFTDFEDQSSIITQEMMSVWELD